MYEGAAKPARLRDYFACRPPPWLLQLCANETEALAAVANTRAAPAE